jgi:hypothetical protein
MKLRISVFNKPQVITVFLPEAIKIAEWFDCTIQINDHCPVPALPVGLDFLPVRAGRIAELEIAVQGNEAGEALRAIRSCMSRCFSEVNFQMN